jgi:iron complex outermembrane recepter protein
MKNLLVFIRFIVPIIIVQPVMADEHAHHLESLDKIIISTPLGQTVAKTALPVTVLAGDELRSKAAGTIAEMLENEPGISNSSFGPGVGQPVIRGQTGSRINVMQNGLGSLDVSNLSPDHPNSTVPFFAEKIEVLRGPSSLLYGSNAIGGVVNVIDNRIPSPNLESPFRGVFEQRYHTVNEAKTSAFKLDAIQDHLAMHLDGMFTEKIDQQIPGLAIDQNKVTSQYNSTGRLTNTHYRQETGSAGFTLFDDDNYVGFSANYQDQLFGVPLMSADDRINIDLRQARYDMKGHWDSPIPGVEQINFRLGYNDYQHTEVENGVAGTIFQHDGFESRLEITHENWFIFEHGVLGIQTKNSEFSAIGDEAIVPKSNIDSFGIFTVQDAHTQLGIYELGLRVEYQNISPENQQSIDHTAVSASASGIWELTENLSTSLSFSHSQRAPDIQELLILGEHHATQSYDIGKRDLTEETSKNIELGFHFDNQWIYADLNLYHNWVSDYVANMKQNRFFDEATESLVDICTSGECDNVYQVQQLDASFQGYELKVIVPILENPFGHLDMEIFSDYVHGEFDNGQPIPRLPPLRYGMELSWYHPILTYDIRLTHAEKQDRAGENETTTDDYWLLNMNAQAIISEQESSKFVVFAKANNLLDQTIRQSVSYLRNIAPAAGRGFEIGIRAEF